MILVAWFFATGSQWDLVQVFGWGRMVMRDAATMSFTQAVRRVFGGEVCGICRAVSQAEQQQQEESGLPPDGARTKIVLACPPDGRLIFAVPEAAARTRGEFVPVSTERAAPPTPPPRFA